MIRAAFAALLLLGCSEPAPSPAAGPAPDRWWLATCGDVQPLQVGHDVMPPQLIERVEPALPPLAPKGIVVVETVVNADGTICAARVLRSMRADVDEAVLAAVRQWRFHPAKLDGVPRAAVYTLSVPIAYPPPS
jgi:protein TonB